MASSFDIPERVCINVDRSQQQEPTSFISVKYLPHLNKPLAMIIITAATIQIHGLSITFYPFAGQFDVSEMQAIRNVKRFSIPFLVFQYSHFAFPLISVIPGLSCKKYEK